MQALQLQRSLDDVEQSVVLVEQELADEDCGADLPSVSRLLKALQGLEEELDGHGDRIQVQRLTSSCCVAAAVLMSFCLDPIDPDGDG